ncbi:hypothetical protein BDZ91DRAFT_678491 [Kalaharituber pfeilii]|nr:hypothetical protein BDZ91DRAFT_678491 [Kalaharituber pfeilii]
MAVPIAHHHHLPAGKLHDDFTTWAITNGIKINKVKVAAIPHAGIGIVATTDIIRYISYYQPGETLVFTPASSLLTREVIVASLTKIKHRGIGRPGLRDLRTHALIAAGIATRAYKDQQPWQDVWPTYENFKEFMPLLWESNRQDLLPPSTQFYLTRQREKFESDFKKARNLGFEFTQDAYAHAWVIVNTRTLFYRPSSYNTHISREDCMCLCPFIDYFNHSDVGCKVELSAQGFTVTSNRAYSSGEQIFVSYGPHNNDFLLCEYGFILDSNQWDEVNIDNYVFPHLTRVQKEHLDSEGFLGGYNFDTATCCFRTQVALRMSLIPLNSGGSADRLIKWRRFIEGIDDGTKEEPTIQSILKDILAELRYRGDKVLAQLDEPKGFKVVNLIDNTIRRRWEQIQGIIDFLEQNLGAQD